MGLAPTDRRAEYIELHRDPPPDLVVEIDISRSSLIKLGLFAAFGVPEVWRYRGNRLEFWVLAEDEYRLSNRSVVLPGVQSDQVSGLVAEVADVSRRLWLRRVRERAEGLPR